MFSPAVPAVQWTPSVILYSETCLCGHPLGQDKLAVIWPDYRVQFQQISTQLFGCFIEVDLVIQVLDLAGLDSTVDFL